MEADYDNSLRGSGETAGSLLARLSSACGKVADAAQRAQQTKEDASKTAVTYIERLPDQTVPLGFLRGLLWSRR